MPYPLWYMFLNTKPYNMFVHMLKKILGNAYSGTPTQMHNVPFVSVATPLTLLFNVFIVV